MKQRIYLIPEREGTEALSTQLETAVQNMGAEGIELRREAAADGASWRRDSPALTLYASTLQMGETRATTIAIEGDDPWEVDMCARHTRRVVECVDYESLVEGASTPVEPGRAWLVEAVVAGMSQTTADPRLISLVRAAMESDELERRRVGVTAALVGARLEREEGLGTGSWSRLADEVDAAVERGASDEDRAWLRAYVESARRRGSNQPSSDLEVRSLFPALQPDGSGQPAVVLAGQLERALDELAASHGYGFDGGPERDEVRRRIRLLDCERPRIQIQVITESPPTYHMVRVLSHDAAVGEIVVASLRRHIPCVDYEEALAGGAESVDAEPAWVVVAAHLSYEQRDAPTDPRLVEQIARGLSSADENERFAAGYAAMLTPWREPMLRLREFIELHPHDRVAVALRRDLEHHLANA